MNSPRNQKVYSCWGSFSTRESSINLTEFISFVMWCGTQGSAAVLGARCFGNLWSPHGATLKAFRGHRQALAQLFAHYNRSRPESSCLTPQARRFGRCGFRKSNQSLNCEFHSCGSILLARLPVSQQV